MLVPRALSQRNMKLDARFLPAMRTTPKMVVRFPVPIRDLLKKSMNPRVERRIPTATSTKP